MKATSLLTCTLARTLLSDLGSIGILSWGRSVTHYKAKGRNSCRVDPETIILIHSQPCGPKFELISTPIRTVINEDILPKQRNHALVQSEHHLIDRKSPFQRKI